MEKEALVPKLTSSPLSRQNENVILVLSAFLASFALLSLFFIIAASGQYEETQEIYFPDTTILSMNFMVLNITETRVKWDLSIRLPRELMPYYRSPRGDFQVFIVYKAVTIATSSPKRYNLISWKTKQLNVSLIASEEDMEGVIVKNIMEDIKERGEIRFGSRLILTDCRHPLDEKRRRKLNYSCDEATLRFESGSRRNATLFENQPNCLYLA